MSKITLTRPNGLIFEVMVDEIMHILESRIGAIITLNGNALFITIEITQTPEQIQSLIDAAQKKEIKNYDPHPFSKRLIESLTKERDELKKENDSLKQQLEFDRRYKE